MSAPLIAPPVLEASGLVCVRGDRPLFSDLAFALQAGEALYVTGANGAGKTSLLRTLCGLSAPAEGDVCWCGESIFSLREEFFGHLLYLGHAAALKDELTATENLVIGATLAGHAVAVDTARNALQELGLRGREDLPARVLSQGQRRRVNLARLMLPGTPRLWVLDEPFNALDVRAVAQLTGIIGGHLAAGGMAVYTTHQEVSFSQGLVKTLNISGGKGRPC
jgi:heme exporter protein A